MLRLRLLCIIILLCCCSETQAGTIRHDVSDSAYLSLAAESQFDSVGQFSGTTSSFSFLASGVLIANDWVLTAGHVVDSATSLMFSIGGVDYTGDSWISHPGWTGDLLAGFDIGLVHLSSVVAGIDPATRYTGSQERSSVGTSVGFGLTGTGLTGITTADGLKRAGTNRIEAQIGNGILLSDFDNPAKPPVKSDNVFSSPKPTALEFLIAPGDSGGGLFLDDKFLGWVLAGIHSFGAEFDGMLDSDYGDVSGHTRVSIFNAWIDSILGGAILAGGLTGTGAGRLFMADALGATAVIPNPEPSSLALLCAGTICLIGFRLRRRHAVQSRS